MHEYTTIEEHPGNLTILMSLHFTSKSLMAFYIILGSSSSRIIYKLIPQHRLQHKVQIMAGTEPLNDEGSPQHREAWNSSKAGDGGLYGRKKKDSQHKEEKRMS